MRLFSTVNWLIASLLLDADVIESVGSMCEGAYDSSMVAECSESSFDSGGESSGESSAESSSRERPVAPRKSVGPGEASLEDFREIPRSDRPFDWPPPPGE